MQQSVTRTATALAVGSAGALIAWALGLPAPMLMGPAMSVTLAAVMGLRMTMPVRLRDTAFVIIGTGMGAGVTPETIEAMRTWPISVVLLGVAVTAILFAGAFANARLFGKDWQSSVLAASPGHLSYILGLGLEVKGDLTFITVVQSLRLLALTLLVPVVVVLGGTLDSPAPPPQAMSPFLLVFVLLAGAAFGFLLLRFRIPAALLLGGMFTSSVLHGTGWVEGGLPQWLSIPAFLVMGTLIGSRFDNTKWSVLRSALGASFVLTSVSVGIAFLGALVVSMSIGLPVMQVLIAFAPGGVETMAAMAVLLDADPAYVAAHHVLRLFLLTALVPLALRLGRTK